MEPFSDPDLLNYMNYFGKELRIPWLTFMQNCTIIFLLRHYVDMYLKMRANYFKPDLGRVYV